MTILLMMAAAAAVAPVAPQPQAASWGGSTSGSPGAVLFTLFIDPQGRPMGCDVVQVYGSDFSRDTCDKVQATTFRPARGTDGRPTYGFFRAVANYGAAGALKSLPDLSLNVKPIPGLLTETREVKLAVVIDKSGKVAECAGAGDAKDAALAKAGCAQFKAQWDDTPLEDPQGFGRRYVRELTVAFVPEGAKP